MKKNVCYFKFFLEFIFESAFKALLEDLVEYNQNCLLSCNLAVILNVVPPINNQSDFNPEQWIQWVSINGYRKFN